MDNDASKSGKTENHEKRPPFILKDLGEVLGITFFAPLSWIMPACLWKFFCYPAALAFSLARFSKTRSKIQNIKKVRGDHFDSPGPGMIEVTRSANVMEQKIQYLREYGPGGWKPAIEIKGLESVEKALEAGKGGILWVAPFFFNNLILKKGFYQAGLQVSHLSAYNHGPSFSRFGLERVNKVYIGVENKFLQDRVVIQPARDLTFLHAGTNLNYVRKLERKLRDNGLVSIRCQPDPALDHQGVLKKVLDGKLSVAAGAPSLALATGCALLPVFTIRKASNLFAVVIEKPIEVPREGTRQEKMDAMIDQYARIMEIYVAKHPFLFIPWHEIVPDLPGKT